MKKRILNLVVALVVSTTAFANPIDGEKKEVKTEKSSVTWKAYKFSGSHYGTVSLKSGNLVFTDGVLTGGEFTVDMTTINTTDLKEDQGKGKLDGHLKSEDFFSVEKNPTSTLVFTKVEATGKNSYKVTGDLTIKGTTEPITFDLSVYGSKANATLKVDRTKYDIKYGSGLLGIAADKVIYDEFDLVVDLEF